MTHPIAESVVALAVAVTIGVGALVVLPGPSGEHAVVDLESSGGVAVRVVPTSAMTPSERLDALQRELAGISAEHKRLASELREASASARKRKHERRVP